jgi:membrane protein YqaA with SNARE-associated domain
VGVNGIAALWGFAEATLFFIVPDVWLTTMAVWSPRKALIACLFALLGALAGGALMYGWGAIDPVTALTTLDRIPAIKAEMIASVAAEIREHWPLAPFLGPLQGIPYKLYAVQASAQGVGLGAFLLISIPARLIRFVVLTLVASLLFSKLLVSWTPRRNIFLLGGGWVAFYTGYFLAMAGG